MMATFGRYNSGPVAPEITITADQATGLAADLEVITRGARKTSGGNAFVMGRVIPGVTSRIRSVDVGHKGGRFTLEQVAALVTLPREYAALAEGSRTSICQQFADIVAPVVSAAVFGETVGHIFGIKRNRGGWLPLLLAYLREQYPGAKAVLNTKSATPEAGGRWPKTGAEIRSSGHRRASRLRVARHVRRARWSLLCTRSAAARMAGRQTCCRPPRTAARTRVHPRR
ncbi:hypothetical protein ACIQGT_36525 [Streptomyces sp. NPDC093108]|uniref:hypothetical protein n=1 Tax=Streptomyces sp. NPDC093108 TaxID=3366030 RepID=UPI0038222194